MQWQERFLAIMEECIPRKVLPPRRNLPCLNKGIIQSIRRRNNLFKRAKNSPKDIGSYKRARNRVISQLRNAKRDYFRKLNPSNPKQFWKSVKILNKQNSSIPVQSKDSNVYSTDQEKADVLNSFFCKNFNYSISPITPLDSSYENDPCPMASALHWILPRLLGLMVWYLILGKCYHKL